MDNPKFDGKALLAIDTTGAVCSAALARIGGGAAQLKILAEFSISGKKSHTETLMPAIDAACALSGVSREDIAAAACSIGPGSFTGIRIGCAAAKGFALSRDIPLVPVSSLAALAYGAALRGFGDETVFAPVIDARRGQVYSAFYRFQDGLPVEIDPPGCRMFEDVLRDAAARFKSAVFTGGGAGGREDIIRESGFAAAHEYLWRQSAAHTAALAAQALFESENAKNDFPVSAMQPFYARLTEAEQNLKAGK